MNRSEWPFQRVLDSRRQEIGWVLLNGPIVTQVQQHLFAELRRGRHRFAGMSSYMTFPQSEPNDWLDYQVVCEVWCHCFRNPDQYLQLGLPRALISASDFTDYVTVAPDAFGYSKDEREFDFVYVGASEDWKRAMKNWQLAARCVPLLCRKLHLRALVIGSPDSNFRSSNGIRFTEELPWHDLLAVLCRARFLFAPNLMDPSPRLLAEALCLNVPIVVNRQILGGWKYVNLYTGVFFDGEADVVAAVQNCLNCHFSPREWFRANYGPYLAGARLLQLLKTVDTKITESSRVVLDPFSLQRPREER